MEVSDASPFGTFKDFFFALKIIDGFKIVEKMADSGVGALVVVADWGVRNFKWYLILFMGALLGWT